MATGGSPNELIDCSALRFLFAFFLILNLIGSLEAQ
jgi:hypothetical protein